MDTSLIAKANVIIHKPAAKVWDALTNPHIIKQYFFGTNAISDWKVGSELIFRGEWEGKTYEDKGTILESVPNKLLKYTYLSSMSGLEDKPENYANITYELQEEVGKTMLSITQDNIANEKAREHSAQNWQYVLNSMKELLEKQF
jgi:uncharacterized protein YndB with AHSA1/START domain